jgi:hypothetical protein
MMGVAGKPVQVRNHNDAGILVTMGPYLSSGLPVAGFAPVEAANLEAAIQIAANTPLCRRPGVSEGWPLDPPPEAAPVRITANGEEVLGQLSAAILDELATSAEVMRRLVAELEQSDP